MSGQEPPPMSPALRALIDADNQRPGPSDGVRTGVYAALGVSLGVLPAGAIAAAEAATAATTTSATAGTTAAAATPAAAAASTVIGATKVVGPLAFLAQAPLIGVGVGAVLGAALTAYVITGSGGSKAPAPRVEPAPVVAAAPVAAPPPTVEPAPTPEPEPAVAPSPVEPPRANRTTAAPKAAPTVARRAAAPAAAVDARTEEARKAASSGALAAEQSLLDPARAALASGDGASALSRLAVHERRFPAGLLSQEREAMAIRALVLTGARADAERRAAAFRSRYPGSLLGPTIDATLRARP